MLYLILNTQFLVFPDGKWGRVQVKLAGVASGVLPKFKRYCGDTLIQVGVQPVASISNDNQSSHLRVLSLTQMIGSSERRLLTNQFWWQDKAFFLIR